ERFMRVPVCDSFGRAASVHDNCNLVGRHRALGSYKATLRRSVVRAPGMPMQAQRNVEVNRTAVLGTSGQTLGFNTSLCKHLIISFQGGGDVRRDCGPKRDTPQQAIARGAALSRELPVRSGFLDLQLTLDQVAGTVPVVHTDDPKHLDLSVFGLELLGQGG